MGLEDDLREAARAGKATAAGKLIKKGVDVDAAEEADGWAPLHYAANGNTTGHYKTAVVLLKAEADVDIRNGEGETALHLAAARGDEAMVDVLLVHEASITIEDNRGRTAYYVAIQPHPTIALKITQSKKIFGRTRTDPTAVEGIGADKRQKKEQAEGEQELREASQEGDLVGVEEVLNVVKGINIDALDDQGNSALWLAAFHGRKHIVKELLDRGANPGQARVDSGQTALHISAGEGYVSVVRVLLPKLKKSQIDARDNLGRTALLGASAKGHADVVQVLLSAKANINLANNENESPLYVAATGGHLEVVRSLLDAPEPQRSNLEIDASAAKGYTPLHAAASKGNIMIAREILDRGANKEARDDRGQTPLFVAAEAGQTRMSALLAQEYKADVNASNLFGETPLFVASLKGHVAVVNVLIKHGGDTEAAEDRGITPLMIAAQDGQSAVISKLLEHGANVHATNNVGETPLLIAALEGYNYAVAILLENGADLKAAQKEGKTALHLASRDGHVGVVHVLLKSARIKEASESKGKLRLTPLHMTADTRGETALHLAVRFGHLSVVELLLEHDEYSRKQQESLPEGSGKPVSSLIYGTLVDAPNKFGWTALHVAVDSHQGSLLNVLIKKKVNVNPSDKFGNKPLHLASRQRDARMVSELLMVPDIDLSGVNVDGRTALHFASACVRPNSIAEELNNGADPYAQDKNGKLAIDVLGDQTVCNPNYVIDVGMCTKSPIEGSPSFTGDFCPIAQGGGTGLMESKAILQMAMSKNASTISIRSGNPEVAPVSTLNPPVSSSGGNSIVVPMVAALVPMLAIVLFLIFAIFKLAKKRQDQKDTNDRIQKKQKGFSGSFEGKLGAQASKNLTGYYQKGCSPRTAESVPADYQFIADPRNMVPFDQEELHMSPLDDAGYVDSSDGGASSEDGSCCWSDDSADSSPNVLPGQRDHGLRGVSDTRDAPGRYVSRTMSKSSSDGEMNEREKQDAVGPLPSKRSPKNKHARGWLVGRSSSGRRLIGLKGGGRLPPKPKKSKRGPSQPSLQAQDHVLKVSGSLTDAPHRGDLPSPRRDSFGFEGHSSQAYPEHDPACNIEMQRQWSWS